MGSKVGLLRYFDAKIFRHAIIEVAPVFTRFTELQLSQLFESLVTYLLHMGKIVDKVLGVGKQLFDIPFSYAIIFWIPTC
jgi:hypothetical protein